MLVALFGEHRIVAVWVKDIHCFEIESTYSPHKCFLQIFLHIDFLHIIALDGTVSFFETFSQCFNLFAVASCDILDFKLNCSVKFLFVVFLFPDKVFLDPGL